VKPLAIFKGNKLIMSSKKSLKPRVYVLRNLELTREGTVLNLKYKWKDRKERVGSKSLKRYLLNGGILESMELGELKKIRIPKEIVESKGLTFKGMVEVERVQ